MLKILVLGVIGFGSFLFAENTRVLEDGTEGQDRWPSIFRISSGSMYVIWECEKYLGDYDIILTKYRLKSSKWIWWEVGGYGWPFTSPFVNNHHPAVAIRNFDDKIYAFASGPYPPPPPDTIGDNFFWAASADSGTTWPVIWLPGTEWFKDCSNLAAAHQNPDMFALFQDNQDPDNPDIRAWYFVNEQPYQPLDIAVESYPETEPAITGSSAGFVAAYQAKPTSSWDIVAKKLSGTMIGAPINIANDKSKDELHPALASSGNYFYCAYTKGNDIYLAYSTDGGEIFQSVAVAVSSEKQDWPAVACSGPKVDIAYYHASGNIYHRHSNDNGVTWSNADVVTTQPAAIDTPRVAILYGNPCHVVWVDNRDGTPNLYYGRTGTAAADETQKLAVSELKVSPNPFAATTTIEYSTGAIEICDALGRMVKKFTGPGPALWDGSKLPAGVYFINFKHTAGIKTCKAILLK